MILLDRAWTKYPGMGNSVYWIYPPDMLRLTQSALNDLIGVWTGAKIFTRSRLGRWEELDRLRGLGMPHFINAPYALYDYYDTGRADVFSIQ